MASLESTTAKGGKRATVQDNTEATKPNELELKHRTAEITGQLSRLFKCYQVHQQELDAEAIQVEILPSI